MNELQHKECEKIISKAANECMFLKTLAPILIDDVAVLALQSKMIYDIASVFKEDISVDEAKELAKKLISAYMKAKVFKFEIFSVVPIICVPMNNTIVGKLTIEMGWEVAERFDDLNGNAL